MRYAAMVKVLREHGLDSDRSDVAVAKYEFAKLTAETIEHYRPCGPMPPRPRSFDMEDLSHVPTVERGIQLIANEYTPAVARDLREAYDAGADLKPEMRERARCVAYAAEFMEYVIAVSDMEDEDEARLGTLLTWYAAAVEVEAEGHIIATLREAMRQHGVERVPASRRDRKHMAHRLTRKRSAVSPVWRRVWGRLNG